MDERTRVRQEREQALKTARKSDRRLGYAVQQSEGFLLSSKKYLDPATEAKVTQAIFELSDVAPYADAKTGLRSLPIPGTRWQIAYDVDHSSQRVRIYNLVPAEANGSPAK
jgi:hypothetical protein